MLENSVCLFYIYNHGSCSVYRNELYNAFVYIQVDLEMMLIYKSKYLPLFTFKSCENVLLSSILLCKQI